MSLPWSQVHLLAAREAARAHRALHVDTTRQIDPFAALAAAGVLVLRRRLDHLAGLYLPPEPSEGRVVPAVLINVAHVPSRQRFTAAHELCHHLRDHTIILDSETELLTRGEIPASDRERIAEAFAAWFLMPKRLVLSSLATLGLQPATLSPEGAYALSLALGTSYAATVHHLADMRLLTTRRSEELVRVEPQAIKRAIGGLDAMVDAWKDVHLVQVGDPEMRVFALEGDVLIVQAPEVPSSGYLWQIPASTTGLALVRDEYREPGDSVLGGRGQHRFVFRVESAGSWDVALELRRPWQRDMAAETTRVHVTAQPQPTQGIVNPDQLVAA